MDALINIGGTTEATAEHIVRVLEKVYEFRGSEAVMLKALDVLGCTTEGQATVQNCHLTNQEFWEYPSDDEALDA